jgi:hypothetical protein
MNVNEKTSRKKKPKDALKSGNRKTDAETEEKGKFDIFRLLDDEGFLRALKEKLEAV